MLPPLVLGAGTPHPVASTRSPKSTPSNLSHPRSRTHMLISHHHRRIWIRLQHGVDARVRCSGTGDPALLPLRNHHPRHQPVLHHLGAGRFSFSSRRQHLSPDTLPHPLRSSEACLTRSATSSRASRTRSSPRSVATVAPRPTLTTRRRAPARASRTACAS